MNENMTIFVVCIPHRHVQENHGSAEKKKINK